MTGPRRYQMLCPIARALDHVGDRWTLLVLRDLHAGPARFSDLQAGLPGAASNLLTERLRRLEEDGLLRRREAEFGVQVYELTDAGRATGPLLFELARVGARFPPDDEAKPTGLRRIAVTLQEALRRVVPPEAHLRLGLLVDDEGFEVTIADGDVDVRYQQPTDADLTIATSYEPLVDVGDGSLDLEAFLTDHAEVVAGDHDRVDEVAELLGRALALTRGAPATS